MRRPGRRGAQLRSRPSVGGARYRRGMTEITEIHPGVDQGVYEIRTSGASRIIIELGSSRWTARRHRGPGSAQSWLDDEAVTMREMPVIRVGETFTMWLRSPGMSADPDLWWRTSIVTSITRIGD